MKKLTALAALLLAVSAGVTAFAQTEYDPNENSVKTNNQASYNTVLITKGDGNNIQDTDIVYANQADSGFDAAKEFLLKNNPEKGVYTIRLGSSAGTPVTSTFLVGVGIESYDTQLIYKAKKLDSNGTYSWGFTTPEAGVNLSNGIILVKLGDKIMAYPTNYGISGNVNVVFGVQIDEVPEGENVEVYVRSGASIKQ